MTVKMLGNDKPTLVTVPPLPVAEIVIVPLPSVMETPEPAVSVFRDKPLPLPMRICPLAAEDALTPVPPLRGGSTPVTPLARGMSGMSPATSIRNVGMPVEPLGAAKTVFAASLASVAVNVPELVTGLPETVNMLGSANPTLVTVPPAPVAEIVMVPLPFVMVTPDPALSVLSDKPLPLPMNNCPFVALEALTPVPPLVGDKIPVTLLKLMGGKSALTSARNDGTPDDPFGAASTVLAGSLANTAVSVPVVVTGLLEMVKMLGNARPTLVTASADVNNVPVVGTVTLVGPVAVMEIGNAPKVVNEPPSVMVLVPLLTPVPPFAGLRTPPKTTAPLAAELGVIPVVPPLQELTPLFATVIVPEPLVMVMAVPAVKVCSENPVPFPMSSCPLAALAPLTPVPPSAAGSTPVTPVASGMSGRSPATSIRKVGTPDAPFGAANTVLAT